MIPRKQLEQVQKKKQPTLGDIIWANKVAISQLHMKISF